VEYLECEIRAWRMDDAQDLAIALSNKKVLDNLRDGLPFPYTVEDAKAYISAMLNADKEKIYAFAITVNDKVIGSIGVFRQENIHAKTAEMGYYIAEPYWGQGIGTSAVRQVCDRVLSTTDIIRIFAEPFSHNAVSCRILEKSGFVLEGILRKNALKNGQVIDMKMYALIKA
jgi:RimJ/RimL family protein N-acetyltransferase